MKILYLLRHAHAESKNTKNDFQRTLNKDGITEATKVAEMLNAKNILPQQIISSSAARTMETAQIIAKGINYPLKEIQEVEKLYTADENDWLEILKETDNSINSLLMTGHNPSISGFAGALTGSFSSTMPTSSCIIISFPVDRWESIQWRKGKLIDFIDPILL